MKLLFLTQVLDREDAVLGFVSRWVRGLAAECEEVRVIALEVGDTSDLPSNVSWREIGRKGRVGRYLRYKRVLKEALAGDAFDAVLAHMVPRYALVAAKPARRAGAGLFLWYTHAGVDARLRRAVKNVDRAFTASPESLRIDTPVKLVTGHGIDVEHFPLVPEPTGMELRLLSVGRLTPTKDPLTIFEALTLLRRQGVDAQLEIVGGGLTASDVGYEAEVRSKLAALGLLDSVHLAGARPYPEIPAAYASANIVINASLTGSLDKVTLEAMASGRPVISCNDSAPGLFASLGADADLLLFEAGDAERLAHNIKELARMGAESRAALGQRLRQIVQDEHEIDGLMARLVSEMRGMA